MYKYILKVGMRMTTAKIFENGRSQAVRLPKEYRFTEDEVIISKVGEIVMLIPKSLKWTGFLQGLELFSEDYLSEGRNQQAEQERDTL